MHLHSNDLCGMEILPCDDGEVVMLPNSSALVLPTRALLVMPHGVRRRTDGLLL